MGPCTTPSTSDGCSTWRTSPSWLLCPFGALSSSRPPGMTGSLVSRSTTRAARSATSEPRLERVTDNVTSATGEHDRSADEKHDLPSRPPAPELAGDELLGGARPRLGFRGVDGRHALDVLDARE